MCCPSALVSQSPRSLLANSSHIVLFVCSFENEFNVAGQVAQGGFESRVTHVRWSVIVPLAQQLRVCAFINCTQGQVGFICFFVLFFVCVSCCGCISVLAVLAHSFLSLRSFEFCTVSNSWFG